MLQQTRVDTVVPYYERFLAQLPTVYALAEASEDRVLTLWSGLGYYRRARMLHAAAQRVVREHAGSFPVSAEGLLELEGIGRYTAGAVASIAFGQRAALVDGNVARVLARLFAIDDVKGAASARIWSLAESLISTVRGAPGEWNQALMELGATICTPRDPACSECPVATVCEAKVRGLQGLLPRVHPKRQPLLMRRVTLVLASTSSILLARRKRDALFGGLWEPPGVLEDGGGRARALASLVKQLGAPADSLRAMGSVEHVLSHRRMKIAVVRGPLGRKRSWPLPKAEYDAIEVVPLARLETLARASLVTKILAVAEVANSAPRGLRSTR